MNDDYSTLAIQQMYIYQGLKEVSATTNALDIVDPESLFDDGNEYSDLRFNKRILAAALLARRSIIELQAMLLQQQDIPSNYDRLATTALSSVDDIETYLGGRVAVSLLAEIKMIQQIAEFEARGKTA